MKESRLQRHIRSILEQEIGGVWCKMHGNEYQEPGIGDLMGCVRGLHFEIEVKTDTGTPRATQLLRCKRITTEGEGYYFFVRSAEEAVRRVASTLRRHGKVAKNPTAGLPNQVLEGRIRKRDRRIIHVAADRKNPYFLPRVGKVVARKITP